MVAFLFWNLGKSPRPDLVGAVCHENGVDVVILAEAGKVSAAVISSLNSFGGPRFDEAVVPVPSAISFFHRLPPRSITPMFDDGRVAIRLIKPPLGREVIVAACHLPSKLYQDSRDQAYTARHLRQRISEAEKSVGHQDSIVVGDLNMNPFEDGMAAADGMNAVMDKQVAIRPPRVIKGQTWDYFYNPMWSRLGDESNGPTGNYYRTPQHISDYYWHTFDQVLLRPSLLPFYKPENLKVLTLIGSTPLLKAGKPDGSISDHLPVFLRLETEKEGFIA